MKLLIVSHTPHYLEDQTYVGWGPTIREIDQLATLFDEVVHIAPLHRERAEGALPYQAPNVRFRPVRPSGGERVIDKFSILAQMPNYLRVISEEWRKVDAVHVRCPANISIMALLMMLIRRRPAIRWIKYAGNWQPGNTNDPLSYRFQRWFLNLRLHRAVVTINGSWKNQRPHVLSFYNPCLTSAEIMHAREGSFPKKLSEPVRLIFVGRLEKAKGTNRALEILALLRNKINVTLDLVGDGIDRKEFERLATSLGISDRVTFHGWLPRPNLAPLYSLAHFIILPTDTEGYPKVLSEAMAYGVVPIASNVSCIPQYLEELGVGKTCEPGDTKGFVDAIQSYIRGECDWEKESRCGMQAADSFSYPKYLQAVVNMLEIKDASSSGFLNAEG